MSKQIDRWETTYTDKWSGETATHVSTLNEANARGWTSSLARENNCKAECRVVYKDGSSSHVSSEGDRG